VKEDLKDKGSILLSEERLSVAQKVAHFGSWEYDIETGQLWGSEECFKIYGFENRSGYIDPAEIDKLIENPEEVRKAMFDLIDTGKKHEIEYVMTKKNSSEKRTIFSVAELINDQNGKTLKVIGVVQDITDRKIIEKNLRISEKRLTRSQKAAKIGSWEFDLETKQLWATEECFRMYGLDHETGYVIPGEIADLVDDVQKIYDGWDELVKTGKKFDIEYSVRKKGENNLTIVHSIGDLIKNKNGVPTKIVGIMKDVTQRKKSEEALRESEEKYRSFVEHMADGVYKTTHDGKFVEVNQALVSMLGYDSKEELMQVDIKTEIYFDESERERVTENQTRNETEIYRLRKKDGSEVWVEDNGRLILDENGNVIFHEGIIRDVTSRVKIEKELRASEKKYREFVDNMPDGVYKSTQEGKFLEVNEALVKILGYDSKEELMAIDIKTQLYFNLAEREKEPLYNQYHQLTDYCLKKKDGSEIWVEHNGRRVVDKNGIILYREGILRDITEKRKIEQALRESEFILKESQKVATLGSFTTEVKEQLWKSSQILDEFFEIDKDYYRDFDGYVNLVHPEHKELFAKKLIESFEKKERFELEYKVITQKTKKEKWAHGLGDFEFDNNGNIVRMFGTVQDITERKKLEMQLIQSQKVAQLGSYVYDIISGEWTSSQILDEILQIDHNYKHDFEGYVQLIHPDFKEIFITSLTICVEKNQRFEIEYKIIRNLDRTERWVHGLGDFEIGENGKPIKMFGTIQDITDRKKLEMQLVQAQKLEGLGTLAGGIAHDFNNLMAILLGNAELLRTHLAENTKQIQYVDQIIDVADRGASISKQLLLFSRQSDLNMKPISLSGLINELKSMLGHFIPKKITIKTAIEVENGLINGDAGHIHQVLLNLCLNARDAMGESGTLTITEKSTDASVIKEKFSKEADGKYVVVSISDTGSGIDDSILSKIFDPFFTTKEKGKGSGLGLSIVDGLVKSHNGFIEVKSKKGEGTTFNLYFPAINNVDNYKSKPSKYTAIAGKVILVVDDEKDIRELFREYLEMIGTSVILASDGIEALEIYKKMGPGIDVVISDLGMPNMSGEELFQNLKKLNPKVNVIISSGYLDRLTRESIMQLGVKEVIAKPYKFVEIANILEKLFTNKL